MLATAGARNKIQRANNAPFLPLPVLLCTHGTDFALCACCSYRSMGDHTETTEIDFDPSVVSYEQVGEIRLQALLICFVLFALFDFYVLFVGACRQNDEQSADGASMTAWRLISRRSPCCCRFSTRFGRSMTRHTTAAAGSECSIQCFAHRSPLSLWRLVF